MDKIVKKYYQLKQQQKETEQQLKELRDEITAYCEEQGVNELEIGAYRVKLVNQARKEYDDTRLFEALPDLELWRMLSKPDPSKIASLVKLGVIPEGRIQDTFLIKEITLLHVEKK